MSLTTSTENTIFWARLQFEYWMHEVNQFVNDDFILCKAVAQSFVDGEKSETIQTNKVNRGIANESDSWTL